MTPAKQDRESFTIKCSLNRICSSDAIKDQITEDVLQMSELTVEAAIYIRHLLYSDARAGVFPKGKIEFDACFKHLRQHVNPNSYPLSEQYEDIREELGMTHKYICHHNPFNHAWKAYKTAFINNIVTHMETRVNRFLKNYQTIVLGRPNKTVAERDLLYRQRVRTLTHVFGPNDVVWDIHDDELLEALAYFGWDGQQITKFRLQDEYYRYFRLLYYIQDFNTLYGLKNFHLVPIYRHGRHHIRYDATSFKDLIRRVYGRHQWDAQRSNEDNWRDYFNFNRLVRPNQTFPTSISTDGVAVSIYLTRPKPHVPQPKRKQRRIEQDEEMEEEGQPITCFVGLDPGERDMFAGVVRFADQPNRWYTIKCNANGFRGNSGHYERKRVRKKERNRIDSWYNRMASQVSPMSRDPEPYTRFHLKYFMNKQTVYSSKKCTYLRFRKYIGVHRAATRLAKSIAIRGKETLVVVGNHVTAANSPIKGHIRSPKKLILEKLQIFANVKIQDEFRTSQLCSSCHSVLEHFRTSDRYKFCKNSNCRSNNWNRDVNAGRNILYRGLMDITNQEPHPNFNRNFRPPRYFEW